MTTTEKRNWVYNSQTLDELKSKYNSWADSYDVDLGMEYKQLCFKAATHLSSFLEEKPNLSILDVGCGTGLVGEGLHQHGHLTLSGIDISENMLKVARNKNIYKNLLMANIKEINALYVPELFDAAICVGVFTYNHLDLNFLPNIGSILKKEGIFEFAIIKELLENTPRFQQIISNLPWQLLDIKEITIAGNEWSETIVNSYIFRI